MNSCRTAPCVLVGRNVKTFGGGDGDIAALRTELETLDDGLLGESLTLIACSKVDGIGQNGQFSVQIDVVGEDSLLLHLLGTHSCYDRSSGLVEVCGAVAVEEKGVRLGVAIFLIEFLCGGGEVDKRHIHRVGHEFHLVGIVHRVIRLGNTLVRNDTVGGEFREVVAKVVAAVTADC